jgi:hypothetical protein
VRRCIWGITRDRRISFNKRACYLCRVWRYVIEHMFVIVRYLREQASGPRPSTTGYKPGSEFVLEFTTFACHARFFDWECYFVPSHSVKNYTTLLAFGSFAHDPQRILAGVHRYALVTIKHYFQFAFGIIGCAGSELCAARTARAKQHVSLSTDYKKFTFLHTNSLRQSSWRRSICENQTAPVPQLVTYYLGSWTSGQPLAAPPSHVEITDATGKHRIKVEHWR